MPAGHAPEPARLGRAESAQPRRGRYPSFREPWVARAGTTVYDLNGEPLFLRVRLEGSDPEAFVDAAIDPRLGAPLLAVSHADWDPDPCRRGGRGPAERKRAVTYDEARFVAFSYPKLAIQFLREEQEVALLELFTWRQVPPARERQRDEPPGDFDRWSFLAEQPSALLKRNAARHAKRVRELDKVLRARQLFARRLIDGTSSRARSTVSTCFSGTRMSSITAPPAPTITRATNSAVSRPVSGASPPASRWCSISTATTISRPGSPPSSASGHSPVPVVSPTATSSSLSTDWRALPPMRSTPE